MAILERELIDRATNGPSSMPTPRLYSIDEYYKMAKSGVFGPDERTELIEGEIFVKMPPIGPSHNYVVIEVEEVLRRVFGKKYLVRSQMSVRLQNDSEPEPDISVVLAPNSRYRTRLPAPDDIALIVETSDSTLVMDRKKKLKMYARAGIIEYWIIDVKGRKIEVFRDPLESGDYATKLIATETESIATLTKPDKPVVVADVLP